MIWNIFCVLTGRPTLFLSPLLFPIFLAYAWLFYGFCNWLRAFLLHRAIARAESHLAQKPTEPSSMSTTEQEQAAKTVIALFYQNNGNPVTTEGKIQALTRHLRCDAAFFGCGGDVTDDDMVKMLEEEFLIKSNLLPRPATQ